MIASLSSLSGPHCPVHVVIIGPLPPEVKAIYTLLHAACLEPQEALIGILIGPRWSRPFGPGSSAPDGIHYGNPLGSPCLPQASWDGQRSPKRSCPDPRATPLDYPLDSSRSAALRLLHVAPACPWPAPPEYSTAAHGYPVAWPSGPNTGAPMSSCAFLRWLSLGSLLIVNWLLQPLNGPIDLFPWNTLVRLPSSI